MSIKEQESVLETLSQHMQARITELTESERTPTDQLLLKSGSFSVGASYKLVSVSSVADANEFNGLYLGGKFSNPTLTSSFT
jgi:hypothetical protein